MSGVNMEIKPLSKEVITKLQSTGNINNLTQCVSELVLNSLDAGSSAIAIRLNSTSLKIQVIDNGIGISQENLEKIAQQYCTNKCQSLADLIKKPKSYGCKGESLWSISNISKILNITSKHTKSEKTFSKNIRARKHEKVTLAKKRQSNGTTITIDGFFHNLPVRQKRTKREFELYGLVNFLEKISIIHPQVSITLRDDVTGKLLFKRAKNDNIIKSLTDLYPEVKYDETMVMKVHKDKIAIEALFSKEIFKEKIIQHLYVNKRPVHHQKLQTFIPRELAKDKKEKSVHGLNPMFVVNIKCSLPNFNVVYENSEAKVEFLNIELIYRCLEKLILKFLGKSKPIDKSDCIREKRKSVCGVSDLVGTVKGLGFKDWLKKDEITKVASAIIEDVVENSGKQIEVAQPSKKPKQRCEVKKNKLKSLPIKIYEQNNNKSKMDQVIDRNINKKTELDLQKENIFIQPSIPNKNPVAKVMMENFRKLEKNCKDITSKQEHDETLFSHFTSTEEKGKDLIMYMFLKSTELFNEDLPPTQVPQECDTFDSSRETIMESNIFFENITRTKTHQLNKTISVSVRLKRRKNVQEKSNYPEISFSVPAQKKRRIDYLNGRKRTMSPYFKKNEVDHPEVPKKRTIDREIQVCLDGNFEQLSEKHMNSSKLWNPFRNDKNMRGNILYTEHFDERNIENSFLARNDNIRQGFDQISMFNDSFSKFTNRESKVFRGSNQSYLFNFENIGMMKAGNNIRLHEESQIENEVVKRMPTEGPKYNPKSNLWFETFDFGNLSLSPIPKIDKPSERKIQNIEFAGVFKTPRNITTLKKYASEGEFLNVSSPYFSKEKVKYNSKNYDNFSFSLTNNELAKNKIETKAIEKFRRYHTEPLEDSRFQYIQNVKKNIDKIFMGLKHSQDSHSNNEKTVTISKREIQAEMYTMDSLEEDKNKHNCMQNIKNKDKNISPLWKKFIRNKYTRMKIHDRIQRKSVSNQEKPKKSDYFEGKLVSAPENNINESPDLFSSEQKWSLNEVNVKDLTFLPNSVISFDQDAVFRDQNVDIEKDVTTLTAFGPTALSSNLIITIDEENEEENGCEIDTVSKLGGDVCNAGLRENEWIKKIGQDGKEFYFNEKTGITSYLYPKTEEIYNFKQRPEYMPKGLSPLLVPHQKLDISLSPVSKEKLHDEILRSYADDLGLIKWENCIKGCDPKKFFENLYHEKVSEYEKEIPSVIKTKISKFTLTSSTEHRRFNRIVFSDFRVIGQIDQKFIASIDKKKFDLILFDQHAVHERIRLEELQKEYEGKSSRCENVTLFMNQPDVELLIEHTKYLNGIGVHFRNLKNGITIYEVPSCLLNKVTKEFPLQKLLQLFIRELLELARNTRGVLTGFPTMMNQIINMEACRGAVKFGETLNREKMEKLIEELSRCILPFQCAHGRPTLMPLLKLTEIADELVEKPKLWRLIKR